MEKNAKSKKSNSEIIPFNISKLSTLRYIKVIFLDNNKELCEMNTEISSIKNDVIQLYISGKENINITCPTGIVLKLIMTDAICFAKTILKDIIKTGDKYLFLLNTPQKTIRQQNREFFRINLDRPCILSINSDNNKNQNYIAQTVNISKGGVLLGNIESIMSDEQIHLKLSKGDSCHLVMFLEHNLKIKTNADFVRSEYVDESYRCAFQILNTPQKYIIPFDKYLTNEEFKLLKSIKNN